MAYLGNDLQVAYPTYKNIDDISGSFNSSTTSFPLRVNGVAPVPPPLNSQQCLISVGGVVQRPDDSGSEGFRLSGGNIIFASAPTTGADFFGVILAGADYINVGANFPSGTAAVPSITFDSDLDTGIFNAAANEIGFATGGVQRFHINSAGQLNNNLGTAGAPSYSFTGDLNTGIYSPGADQVAMSTGGTGRLFINSSGSVGIGTSSPSNLLEVAGGNIAGSRVSGRTYALINVSSANPTTVNGSGFNSVPVQVGDIIDFPFGQTRTVTAVVSDTQLTVNTAWSVSFAGSNVTGYGSLGLLTNSVNRLHITAGGNVGIGTTTPATTFDLSGAYSSNVTAVAALDINCSLGNYFTKTINGNSTFTVSSVPASRAYSFTLELTHTSGTVTWFAGVVWPNSTAPTLTTGKVHLFMFVTDDGGTTWRGSSLINY